MTSSPTSLDGGFRVRTAADGNAALRELTRGHCDIVLSDLKCRIWAASSCSTIARWPQLVTIIMTGWHGRDRDRRHEAGAYDYIKKPFKMEGSYTRSGVGSNGAS